MQTRVFTNAELEAAHFCTRAGILPMTTTADPKKGAEYVLALAERIKNERVNMAMELSANAL